MDYRAVLISSLILACTIFAISAAIPFGASAEPMADTPTMTVVGTAKDGLNVPRDLEFHPDHPGELWIANRADDSTVTYFAPGTSEQTADHRIDRYANHFLEEASSIAFGAENTFASCQESRNTYNGAQRGNDFMGPTLWPADLEIYAKVNQGGESLSAAQVDAMERDGICSTSDDPYGDGVLGSHIDMNHQSPDCMGIAHHEGNAYWVFDGHNGHIVYYDFVEDHGPGGDDHSDGIVRRYPEADVLREPDVSSHLALDHESGWLYIADTGNGRVRRLDVASGDETREFGRANEKLAEFTEYTGATVEDVVTEGLERPSGIAISGGWLFVGDHSNGHIVIYDLDGFEEVRRLDTEALGLMGIEFDSEGRLWFVDAEANTLVRIDDVVLPDAPTPEPSDTPSPTATPEPTPTPTPIRRFVPFVERSAGG